MRTRAPTAPPDNQSPCLLARVPGPEITLNAAAKLLAWSGDERFAKYRQTDPQGASTGQ